MPNQPFQWLKWAFPASVLLVGWSMFQPLVNRAPENGRRMQCQANLKQIMLAVRQYNQDFDARFPSLDTPAGWRDAITPYAKRAAIFQCPSDVETTPQTADYFFNARLSGLTESSLTLFASTLVFGEGYATADPRVSLSQPPKSWLADPQSPARRHLDGLNVAFLDGHAKWLRPEKIGTQHPRQGSVTFAVR